MKVLFSLRFLHSFARGIGKPFPLRSLRWEINSVYGKLLP
jgi:hypothetical protein